MVPWVRHAAATLQVTCEAESLAIQIAAAFATHPSEISGASQVAGDTQAQAHAQADVDTEEAAITSRVTKGASACC